MKLVNGEEIGARKPTRKGDDVRLRRELEELADHRASHCLCSLSVTGRSIVCASRPLVESFIQRFLVRGALARFVPTSPRFESPGLQARVGEARQNCWTPERS